MSLGEQERRAGPGSLQGSAQIEKNPQGPTPLKCRSARADISCIGNGSSRPQSQTTKLDREDILLPGQGVGMEAHQLSEGSMDTSIKSMEATTTKACSHTFSATGEAQQVVPDLGIPVGTAGPAVMMALLQCLGSRLHSHFQIQFLSCRRRSAFGLVGPGPRQRAPSREGKREKGRQRLGVNVCGGGPCLFYRETSDCKGCHALSCLPGGTQAQSQPALALDIAVVNALGDRRWDATCQAAGAACLAYAERKRAHNRTESFCEAAGVWYGNSRVAAHLRPGPFCIGFVEPLLSLQGLILAL